MGAPARIAAEPLLSKLEEIVGLQHESNTYGRALLRGRHEGSFTITQADVLSCKVLGLHPSLVYGSEWWDAQRIAS